MKNHLTKALALLVACLIFSSVAKADDWGTIKGKFVLDGQAPPAKPITPNKDPQVCGVKPLVEEVIVVGADGGLANIFVYVKTAGLKVHPDYEKTAKDKVTLDNAGCRFEPHALFLRTTQTLELKNSDAVAHNSKGDPLKNKGFNPAIGANSSVDQPLTEEESSPFPVSCSIHDWMKAKVLVRANPYAAVSNSKGEFEIKNLPAGAELEFKVYLEKYVADAAFPSGKTDKKGSIKFKVEPGDKDLGAIKVPLSSLQ
jgi:plastocyanin